MAASRIAFCVSSRQISLDLSDTVFLRPQAWSVPNTPRGFAFVYFGLLRHDRDQSNRGAINGTRKIARNGGIFAKA